MLIDALEFPMVAVSNGDDIAAEYGVEYIPAIMIVDPEGRVAYNSAPTALPAGSAVASLWSSQVRTTLRNLFGELGRVRVI